jgi:hypothetical protein
MKMWWILIFLRWFYKDVCVLLIMQQNPLREAEWLNPTPSSARLFSPIRTFMWELNRRIQQSGNTAWGVASGNTHKDTTTTTTTSNERKDSIWTSLFFLWCIKMSVVMSSAYHHPSELAVTDGMRMTTEITVNFTFKFFIVYGLFIWVLSTRFTPTR